MTSRLKITQLYEYENDYEAPLSDEVLVELKGAVCYEMLPPELPQLQDVQVYVAFVLEITFVPTPSHM